VDVEHEDHGPDEDVDDHFVQQCVDHPRRLEDTLPLPRHPADDGEESEGRDESCPVVTAPSDEASPPGNRIESIGCRGHPGRET